DNADARLTEIGYKLGTVSRSRYDLFIEKQHDITKLERFCKAKIIKLKDVSRLNDNSLNASNVWQVLKRPEINYEHLKSFFDQDYTPEVFAAVEVNAKYEGYIERQKIEIAKSKKMLCIRIPENFCYASVPSLSNEARQYLEKVRPLTLDQASRISGITPATISILQVALKKEKVKSTL
ncbi:MAG: tRNA uridine-5-carboxymethylaminomethyl(34) synthesis enzyme MnmG, partial [Pseudomonadota bacterium]|nr:tRNA uridine-5-carboxymethylaminomethyl(34) synthesis enzyme MnmG [Pseudomonadota bacterium]